MEAYMAKKRLILALMALMQTVSVPASADIIILKSGEMFDVQDVREENGTLYYIQDNQTWWISADQVERVIRQSTPGKPEPREQEPDAALPLEEDAGFIELKWGQPPSQLPELIKVSTDPAFGGIDQYARKISDPHFGRAPVDNIFYGFWQDGLYTILVEVSNYLDFTDLKTEAFRRYGHGDRESAKVDRYRWRDATTDRFLVYDDATKTGYLWMRSTSVHAKIKALYPDS